MKAMTTMKVCLTIAALFCSVSTVRADFLIDGFTTPFPTQGFGVTSTPQLNVSGTNDRILRTGGLSNQPVSSSGTATINFPAQNSANANMQLVYDLGDPPTILSRDLSSVNNVLRLSFNVAGGGSTKSFTYTFANLQSFSTVGVVNSSVTLTAVSAPDGNNILLVPTSTFVPTGTPTSNMSNIRYLSINITKTAGGSGAYTFTELTAVPEPATMSLLGVSGLAAVIVHRRRRKAQLAAAA